MIAVLPPMKKTRRAHKEAHLRALNHLMKHTPLTFDRKAVLLLFERSECDGESGETGEWGEGTGEEKESKKI